MREKRCPECGQVVLSLLRVMSREQERLFQLILRAGPAGILSDDLFDALYANDPNGGPDRTALKARVWDFNKRFGKVWVIRAIERHGRAGCGRYRIEHVLKH